MPDNTAGDKYVVLSSPSRIDIQLGFARPEIADFSPHAEPAEEPHVQSNARLKHAGATSGFAGVGSTKQ